MLSERWSCTPHQPFFLSHTAMVRCSLSFERDGCHHHDPWEWWVGSNLGSSVVPQMSENFWMQFLKLNLMLQIYVSLISRHWDKVEQDSQIISNVYPSYSHPLPYIFKDMCNIFQPQSEIRQIEIQVVSKNHAGSVSSPRCWYFTSLLRCFWQMFTCISLS